MFCISIVTMNRAEILAQTLQAIEGTCAKEDCRIFVTNNASTDGTKDLLDKLEAAGKLKAWHLRENLGTAGGRNSHWQDCIGHDAIRMDDKVLPLASGWLTALRVQADRNHAITGPPYDPSLAWMQRIAPAVEYVNWPQDHGRGGPLIFIPAEVTKQLGGVDELHPDIKYGWDDAAYIERAMLLGWNYGFSLHVPFKFTAQASPERRAKAMEYHPLYLERLREYREAERDVFLPLEITTGYRMGLEARG